MTARQFTISLRLIIDAERSTTALAGDVSGTAVHVKILHSQPITHTAQGGHSRNLIKQTARRTSMDDIGPSA